MLLHLRISQKPLSPIIYAHIYVPLFHLFSFQNLPEMEKLDLAYNSLLSFDFDYFDQVYHRAGTLHNKPPSPTKNGTEHISI